MVTPRNKSIVCIGDLHLGKLNNLIPQFAEKQIEVLRAVLKAERKRGATDCVLLGDLFDVPEPSQDLLVMLLDTIASVDLTFHVIPGNHDFLSRDTHALTIFHYLSKSSAGRLKVYLKPKLVKISGSVYFMCPHPYHDDVPKQALLGFGHFPWTGAKRDNLSVETHGKSPKGTWVLGDFHGHQSGPRFTYAGSLTKLSFQESDQIKGYLRVTGPKVEFVPIPESVITYDMVAVALSSDKHFKQVKAKKSTFYRATFINGYRPPVGWQSRYPSVVRHVYKGQKKVEAAKAAAGGVFTFDTSLRDTLKLHLTHKEGLSPAALKAAMRLADKYLPKDAAHA